MEPMIVEKPALQIVGLETSFIHALSSDYNATEVITPLWHDILQRRDEIHNPIDDAMYALLYARPENERSHPDKRQYIAGRLVDSVKNIPNGMTTYQIPPTRFAIFDHRGPISQIAETCKKIYCQWLPSSPYEHAGVADIEHYDHRFDGETKDSVMGYWVSIK